MSMEDETRDVVIGEEPMESGGADISPLPADPPTTNQPNEPQPSTSTATESQRLPTYPVCDYRSRLRPRKRGLTTLQIDDHLTPEEQLAAKRRCVRLAAQLCSSA